MKLIVIFLMVLSVISCNSTKSTNNVNQVMIANPFVDCNTVKEAEDIAGFSITIPKELSNKKINYRVLNLSTKMIELIVDNNSDDEITIRKANILDDISGLYYDFNIINTVDINNIKFTLRGSIESYVNAIWQDNGFSYSVYIPSGKSIEYMLNIISQIE